MSTRRPGDIEMPRKTCACGLCHKRLQIVAEARTWIGTPFHHASREKGLAVDCVGLLIGVGNALGLFSYDNRDYAPVAPDGMVRAEIERFCYRLRPDYGNELRLKGYLPLLSELLPGDILLFRIGGAEQHVGLYSGSNRMIHADAGVGFVCEHEVSLPWLNRLTEVYRFRLPEVE